MTDTALGEIDNEGKKGWRKIKSIWENAIDIEDKQTSVIQ